MLPIHAHRDQIVSTIRQNQVTIVVGETGSGKTTQLPLFLYEACFSTNGVIGITEPRRIAASSVAKYVAAQLGTELGEKVGYQVRFDDQTTPSVKVKFMTDGILLREIQEDPELSKYSVIMVDEAHERSVNIDFTLGLLKQLLTRRSDLKVVISSATIDAEKFSRYFNGAPVVTVAGRTFPVDIKWSDRDHDEYDIVDAVVKQVVDIHKNMPEGDILVFMTGQDDIDKVVRAIKKMQDEPPAGMFPGLAGAIRLQGIGGKSVQQLEVENILVLPVHGGLSSEEQQLIFETFPGKRKVIVATNIAETSITIDGVVYVIDSGRIKETHFDTQSGIQSLDVVPHSQSGCNQRAGRAGRTRPGVCYRMYTESNFRTRPQFTEPEIRRMSLAGVVLSMELIGISDVENFDFIDQPDREAFHEAYETLLALGAVANTTGGGLTPLGRSMAELPLEPRIARMVLEAQKYGCIEEVATVAAFLSVRNIFTRPKGKESYADAAQQKFKVERSDALTYLKIWKQYEESGFDKQWCYDNFLHGRSLWEIRSIRNQLLSLLRQRKGEITSTNDEDAIVRSVAAGLIHNLLEFSSRHAYVTSFRTTYNSVFIHPGSSVFGSWDEPRFIVATELMTTSKTFARGVSVVKVEWLPEIAPNHFRFGSPEFVGYVEGEDTATGRRPIIMGATKRMYSQERTVGYQEIRIPIEEARRLQEAKIAKARAEGLVPMVFISEPLSYGSGTQMVTYKDQSRYELYYYPSVTPIEGPTYYGTLQSTGFMRGEADPHFQVFNFPASTGKNQ